MKLKLQTHAHLLSADNLSDAGPAEHMGTVCNNRKQDRVQAHRALLI